ncbi:MAG: thioesterase domain-containing protein [Reichenbachiella sp.]
MEIDINEILEYIHEHIPITAHLEASITEYSGNTLSVGAPLEANINHRNSAFGGSLSAIGILSGWALLFVKLKELSVSNRLVIQNSSFDFLAPATSDFVASAELPDSIEYDTFLKVFKRKGKARIKINSKVYCGSILCGTHTGTYVAVGTIK